MTDDPIIVRLSGADVIEIEPSDALVEVRQYHRDFRSDRPMEDEAGEYAVEFAQPQPPKEPERDVIRAALERAHDRSHLKLGDDDLDVYYEEVVRALGIAEPVALVGNVIFGGDKPARPWYASPETKGRSDGETVWFSPYLPAFDPDDPGDGPLFVMYAAVDGSGATVYAPACGDANELERRLTRAFGDGGWTLDDHGQAVRAGAKNLAHAGEACDDPDCEIHHPEVIEDANERLTALAFVRAAQGDDVRVRGTRGGLDIEGAAVREVFERDGSSLIFVRVGFRGTDEGEVVLWVVNYEDDPE